MGKKYRTYDHPEHLNLTEENKRSWQGKNGKQGSTYKDEGVRKSWSRAVKQVVDTIAPGMNPRRTKNRTGQDNK